MKKVLLSLMLIACSALVSAVSLAQNSFSYQSVIRNNGEVVSNQDVALLISILSGSDVCYQEVQKVKTNAYGNISISVGEGEPKTGSFAAIPWETMQIMMQIEVSTDGTENYVNLGQMQIQPVPYTMYAARTTTVIQPKEASEDPIFEVRDSEGELLFAVYETGVKVFVDEDGSKAAKSKFAVAGRSASKGEQDLLTINTDGTTVLVDDNADKAAKSRFAVAGRSAKGDNNNIITIDGSGSTIYVDDNDNTNAKAAKSKFAVAGRSAKGDNLLTVDNAGATVYVDDNGNTKAAKSRFAVAGRSAKGDKNIIAIDGSGSTIYIDDNTKAAKSRFAVAGRSAKKSENLFTIDGDGSTVYVDFNTSDKAAKSRFAVAGRSAKGAEDALTIDGDQATFYIDADDNDTDKAAKSRFAVAGRSAKDVQTAFVVDGSGTLVYIDEWDDSKAAKSTFAVAGRSVGKGGNNYFTISQDSTRIYINDVPVVDTVSGEVTTPTLASAFAVVGMKQNTDLLVVNRDSTIVKMNTYVEEEVQSSTGVVEKVVDDTKANKVYAKGRIMLTFDSDGDNYDVDVSYTYYHRGNNEYLYLKNYFNWNYYELHSYWLVDGYIYNDPTYIMHDDSDASLQTINQWDSDYKEYYTPQKWDGKGLLMILESELRQAGYKVNFENGVNTYYQEEENETWDVMQSQQNVVTAMYDNDIFKSRLATFNSLIDSTYGISSNGLSIAENLNEMEWWGEEDSYILLDTCVNEKNIVAKENGETGFYLDGYWNDDLNSWVDIYDTVKTEKEAFKYTGEFCKRTLAEIDAMFDNFYNLTVSTATNNPEWGKAEVVNAKEGYKYGDSITLKATPTEGQFFISWSDGSTEQEHTVRVTGISTYKATFGSHTNIYVNTEATETDQTDGSEEKPFATIGQALNKIKELNNSTYSYTVIVKGMSNEVISIANDYDSGNTFPAHSLTLQGAGDNSGICSNNYGSTPLQINAALPVILKNIHVNIDGFVNVNGNALALSIGSSANVTLEQGTQIYGTGDAWGYAKGGVYLAGKLTMNDSASIHNLSANNSGQNDNGAGGIWMEYSGELTMNGTSSIHSCHANISGGAIRLKSGKVTMNDNATIGGESKGCTASSYGGAVYMESGSFVMNDNSSISYCTKGGSSVDGGVIWIETGVFTMNGGSIHHNTGDAVFVNAEVTSYMGYSDDEPTFYKYMGKFIMKDGSINDNTVAGVRISSASACADNKRSVTRSDTTSGIFDMRGGIIRNNGSNGVYVCAHVGDYPHKAHSGLFRMSGSAVVDPATDDVYLCFDKNTTNTHLVQTHSQAQITISGPLTHDGKVAKITPQNYNSDKPVLAVENGVSLANVYQKFDVESQVINDLTINWEITKEGKLYNGFVSVPGTYFNSTDAVANSHVFIANREIAIQNLFACDHEVTQGEYVAVMGTNPSNNRSGDNYPVEKVSWLDAINYCNSRSTAENLTQCYTIDNTTNPATVTCNFEANGYRLPTEAEWEYLARGGSNWDSYPYSGSNNLDEVAWNSNNSGGTTHEVKTTQKANSLGIYDMSGNVWEWCWDYYNSITSSTPATGPESADANYHSERGGWYGTSSVYCEVGNRQSNAPTYVDSRSGFRVVRTVVSDESCTVNYQTSALDTTIAPQTLWKGYYLPKPAIYKPGYEIEWYINNDFSEEHKYDFSQPLTGGVTLYAKPTKLTSLHVKGGLNPGSDTKGTGSADKPLATLSKALTLVTESNQEYTIIIDGELTGTQVIGSSVVAQKLTLKGKNELLNGVPQDSLKGSGSGSVLTINNTTTPIVIENLKITGGYSVQGGGICNNGGTLTLESGTLITRNNSDDYNNYEGGAGLFTNGGTVTINSGAVISSNTARNRGGGLALMNGARVTLNGGEIKNNETYRYGGAVMFCEAQSNNQSSTFTMESGTISGNKVTATSGTDGFGGCVYITQGEFILKGGDIINNTAGNTGGAIHNDDTFTMQGGTLSGNKAINGNGGAISNYNTINITGGTISGNSVTSTSGKGKAIYQCNKENGTFNMGGSAKIEGDNDVYLDINQTITILAPLTADTVAVVTPFKYELDAPIIDTIKDVSTTTPEKECGRFFVTPQSGGTYTEWWVKALGVLTPHERRINVANDADHPYVITSDPNFTMEINGETVTTVKSQQVFITADVFDVTEDRAYYITFRNFEHNAPVSGWGCIGFHNFNEGTTFTYHITLEGENISHGNNSSAMGNSGCDGAIKFVFDAITSGSFTFYDIMHSNTSFGKGVGDVSFELAKGCTFSGTIVGVDNEFTDIKTFFEAASQSTEECSFTITRN